MKRKRSVFLPGLMILFAAVLIAALPTEAEGAIYEDTIRLHILANSDSEEDQAIKLALRDMILLKKSENAPVCFYASKEKALDISSMFSTRKLMSVFELTEKVQDALSKNANVRLTLISLLCNL